MWLVARPALTDTDARSVQLGAAVAAAATTDQSTACHQQPGPRYTSADQQWLTNGFAHPNTVQNVSCHCQRLPPVGECVKCSCACPSTCYYVSLAFTPGKVTLFVHMVKNPVKKPALLGGGRKHRVTPLHIYRIYCLCTRGVSVGLGGVRWSM